MEQKNATNTSPRPAAKAAADAQSSGGASLFSVLAIIMCLSSLAYVIYKFVLGDCQPLSGRQLRKQPQPRRLPRHRCTKAASLCRFLLTMLLCVITFSIERMLTISKAKGSKSIEGVRAHRASEALNANDINGALAACDQQKGSVANVVKAGLLKYQRDDAASAA
ncbi:MAG: hypothetical protein WKG07_33490 [Hymenobacter sp.]